MSLNQVSMYWDVTEYVSDSPEIAAKINCFGRMELRTKRGTYKMDLIDVNRELYTYETTVNDLRIVLSIDRENKTGCVSWVENN